MAEMVIFLSNKLVKHLGFFLIPLLLNILIVFISFSRNPRQEHIPHLSFCLFSLSISGFSLLFDITYTVNTFQFFTYLYKCWLILYQVQQWYFISGAPFLLLIPFTNLIFFLVLINEFLPKMFMRKTIYVLLFSNIKTISRS